MRWRGKPVTVEEEAQHYQSLRAVDASYTHELLSSRRTGRRIAGAFFALAALSSVGTGIMAFRYKGQIVVPVVVDKVHGRTQVIEPGSGIPVSALWATSEQNVDDFVVDYEGYDGRAYGAFVNDYTMVALMSTHDVDQQYIRDYFSGPQSRNKVYGLDVRVQVRIISTQEAAGADGLEGSNSDSAVVYYKTRLVSLGGTPQPWQFFMAKVAFRYRMQVIKWHGRVVNPLGFQVTSYQHFQTPEVGS